jgi:hypothetical protein
MKSYWFLSLLILLTAGTAPANECPELIAVDCGGGSAWFGLRGDGANIAQGQTVTLPCDTYLLAVEFKFVNTGNPNGNVPSMVTGDPIYVTVFDLDMNDYGTATGLMPFDVGEDWIMFDFGQLPLDAGLYLMAAWTDVPRQCNVRFCPDQDPYPVGERYGSWDGYTGPWFPWYGIDDVPFRVYLDEPVDAESATWSGVKATYGQ